MYPQAVLEQKKENNAFLCKPQFDYIKVGFKGVKIIKACFRDAPVLVRFASEFGIQLNVNGSNVFGTVVIRSSH